MSLRPTRFYVEFWDTNLVEKARAEVGEDFDPADVTRRQDFETYVGALRFFRAREDLREGPNLYERKNLRDVTPSGDPRGLLWEWDTAHVEVP